MSSYVLEQAHHDTGGRGRTERLAEPSFKRMPWPHRHRTDRGDGQAHADSLESN